MSSIRDELKISQFSVININKHNSLHLAKNEFQRRKYQFISELTFLLICHNDNREIYKIISHLIVVSLEATEFIFSEKVFTKRNKIAFPKKNDFDYLPFLKKVHTYLFRCSQLSDKERVDFYKLERFLIKQYLEHRSTSV
jgi:hypothetical protein